MKFAHIRSLFVYFPGAARVHSSIQELKCSLTDKGMGRSIRKIERKEAKSSKARAAAKAVKVSYYFCSL